MFGLWLCAYKHRKVERWELETNYWGIKDLLYSLRYHKKVFILTPKAYHNRKAKEFGVCPICLHKL